MNLVTMLIGKDIAGLQENELKTILKGNDPAIKVRTAGNGLIVLSDNTVVKCTKNYYTNPHNQDKSKSKIKGNLECHYTIKGLGVPVEINDCRNCHLRCMEKKEKGELKRIF